MNYPFKGMRTNQKSLFQGNISHFRLVWLVYLMYLTKTEIKINKNYVDIYKINKNYKKETKTWTKIKLKMEK